MTLKKVNSRFFVLSLLFAGLCVTTFSLRAQQPGPQSSASPLPTTNSASPTNASPSPAPVQNISTPTTMSAPQPMVVGVEGHLELDVIIRVEINHLAEWAISNDASKLIPYINGRALKGNYPEEVHASKNHLYFHLEISPENKEVWTDLLGEPQGTKRLVTLSVGPENQAPFDSIYTQNNRLPLTVISPMYGVLALVVVVTTLVVFIWLARKTNIIREPGPEPGGGKLKPYNLGRTQMAIWFFLIYVSYQVIWLITGALDTITPSLLALMGISAGTALSDALIDSGKETTREEQTQSLTAEYQAIEQTIPEAQARITALVISTPPTPEEIYNRDELSRQLLSSRTRLNEITQQLKSITPTASSNVSSGFRRDILSDSNGYSFHRFQIFAWTIVLGIMFLSSVYNNLTMPEFSATLLGLMGISSGTYLGFKFPEKR